MAGEVEILMPPMFLAQTRLLALPLSNRMLLAHRWSAGSGCLRFWSTSKFFTRICAPSSLRWRKQGLELIDT